LGGSDVKRNGHLQTKVVEKEKGGLHEVRTLRRKCGEGKPKSPAQNTEVSPVTNETGGSKALCDVDGWMKYVQYTEDKSKSWRHRGTSVPQEQLDSLN